MACRSPQARSNGSSSLCALRSTSRKGRRSPRATRRCRRCAARPAPLRCARPATANRPAGTSKTTTPGSPPGLRRTIRRSRWWYWSSTAESAATSPRRPQWRSIEPISASRTIRRAIRRAASDGRQGTPEAPPTVRLPSSGSDSGHPGNRPRQPLLRYSGSPQGTLYPTVDLARLRNRRFRRRLRDRLSRIREIGADHLCSVHINAHCGVVVRPQRQRVEAVARDRRFRRPAVRLDQDRLHRHVGQIVVGRPARPPRPRLALHARRPGRPALTGRLDLSTTGSRDCSAALPDWPFDVVDRAVLVGRQTMGFAAMSRPGAGASGDGSQALSKEAPRHLLRPVVRSVRRRLARPPIGLCDRFGTLDRKRLAARNAESIAVPPRTLDRLPVRRLGGRMGPLRQPGPTGLLSILDTVGNRRLGDRARPFRPDARPGSRQPPLLACPHQHRNGNRRLTGSRRHLTSSVLRRLIPPYDDDRFRPLDERLDPPLFLLTPAIVRCASWSISPRGTQRFA